MDLRNQRDKDRVAGFEPLPADLNALEQHARRVGPVRRRRTDKSWLFGIGLAILSVGGCIAALIVIGGLDPSRPAVTNHQRNKSHTADLSPRSSQANSGGAKARNIQPASRADDQYLGADVRGWKRYTGPGQMPDLDGNALPEWRDESGRYSIIKSPRGYAPSFMFGKEHRGVSQQMYFVTFEDAATACYDHKAGQAEMTDMIHSMANGRKQRSARPARERTQTEQAR